MFTSAKHAVVMLPMGNHVKVTNPPLSKIILKEFKEGGINCDIDESTI